MSSLPVQFYSFMPSVRVFFLSHFFILLFLYSVVGQQTANHSVLQHCNNISKSGFRNKSRQYVSDQEVEKSIESMFPLDKYKFIEGLIQKNTTMVTESMKQNAGMYVLNFGVLLLFFLLLILLVPVLLCTKCCDCCCKRGIEQPYSSCELKWPGICVIFLVLALVGLCVVAIATTAEHEQKFNDFKCSLSVMADDIINGEERSMDKIGFIGLNTYLGKVKDFIANATYTKRTLDYTLISNSQNMTTLRKYTATLIDAISKIPSPTGSQLSLTYSRPLTSRNPVALEPSQFPDVLGRSSDPNSIIFNLSSAAVSLNSSLETISLWADDLSNALQNIDTKQVQRSVKEQIRSIEDMQFNIQSTVGIVEKGIAKVYIIGSYVLLGCTIFVCILIFFFQCCLICSDKYQKRSYLTCCCGLLWFFGLLLFVLALGFSLGNPLMLYGCQYLREGFSSEAGYNKNIAKYMNSNSTVVTVVGKCLSSSRDPYFLYENISISGNPNISELSTFQQPSLSQLSSVIQDVSSNFTFTVQTTKKYRTARILDIDNPQMIEQLKNMAKTEQCFPDQWLPSLKQIPPFIQCSLNVTADNSTCRSAEAFMNRDQGCVGCMDSYSIFDRFNSLTELDDQLKIRYAGCFSSGRSELVERLSLIWQNYYNHKKQKIEPVEKRAIKLQTSFNQSKTYMQKQIQPKLKTVGVWLQNQPVLAETKNMTGGIKEEMDCRILGKDIDTSLNIACSAGLVYVHKLRYVYIAAAIITFFICTLATCSISRSYHAEKVRANQALRNSNRDEKQSKPSTERKLVTDRYFS